VKEKERKRGDGREPRATRRTHLAFFPLFKKIMTTATVQLSSYPYVRRERERERKLEGHVVQVYQRKGKGTNVKHDEGNLCVHKRNRGGTTRRGTESREERMRDEEEQTFLSFFSS
jgi:hypothetical protein